MNTRIVKQALAVVGLAAALAAPLAGTVLAAKVQCPPGTNSQNKCYGTNDDDRMTGTKGADYIIARNGADLVEGGRGNDLIVGSADDVLGNDGDDVLKGGSGDDQLIDYDGAEQHYLQAHETAVAIGDRQMQYSALNNLGLVKMTNGTWIEALQIFERQVTVATSASAPLSMSKLM